MKLGVKLLLGNEGVSKAGEQVVDAAASLFSDYYVQSVQNEQASDDADVDFVRYTSNGRKIYRVNGHLIFDPKLNDQR